MQRQGAVWRLISLAFDRHLGDIAAWRTSRVFGLSQSENSRDGDALPIRTSDADIKFLRRSQGLLMKTLLVAASEDSALWADLFRAELPGHDIRLSPPSPGESTTYLAVGNPPPGLIASLTGLELILSLNAGVDRLLAGGEAPADLPVVRMADDGLTLGMTEWVLARVLAWHRQLFAYHHDQAKGVWSPRPEVLARERTAVVLGAGALGGPVARALAAVGFQTRAWSRTPRDLNGVTMFAGPEGLAAALTGADILVNLLPLTRDTEGLIDGSVLSRLAPGALFVNGGRGAHVVDGDLLAALDSGRLGEAALDVFRQEPLPVDHPYWRHPKVRLSPHVAAPTHARTAVAVMAETVRRFERGEPVGPLVDRARGY